MSEVMPRMFFSERYRIAKEFEAWAEEKGFAQSPLNMVAFLNQKGMLIRPEPKTDKKFLVACAPAKPGEKKPIEIFHGVLEMTIQKETPPIECDKNCHTLHTFMTGIARRKDGACSVMAMLESYLKAFNGKNVRMLIQEIKIEKPSHPSV